MKRQWLFSILILASIVLQSFATIAMPFENHQTDVEHLQTVHVHDNESAFQETDQAGHDIKDCHHCGHCSGSHFIWLTVKTSSTAQSINTIEPSSHLVIPPAEYIETTFIPPISDLI